MNVSAAVSALCLEAHHGSLEVNTSQFSSLWLSSPHPPFHALLLTCPCMIALSLSSSLIGRNSHIKLRKTCDMAALLSVVGRKNKFSYSIFYYPNH